ncbi:salicylate hydroxylase [Colletotrichum incanum]|nr:salicylate hydroxylase [Colletotrichum incanum]
MQPPAPRIVGICGAAIAGPTLALHLLSHPVLRTLFRPILFDQSPAPVQATTDGSSSSSSLSTNHHQRAGASVALLPNGLHPLLTLGLGDAIRKHGYECDDLTLWSGPSSLYSDLDAPLTHLKTMVNGFWSHDMQMGAMYFERAGLQSLLVNRVQRKGTEEPWHAAVLPSQYPTSATIAILRAHQRLHHPFAGDFKTMLNSADRIIHTPLRQRVWKEDEIQWSAPGGGGSIVLLGDAARLMLPTSGQGTGFAIEDATVLASMLLKRCGSSMNGTRTSSTAGSDLRAAVEDYARLRVPRVKKIKDPWPMDGRFNVDKAN